MPLQAVSVISHRYWQVFSCLTKAARIRVVVEKLSLGTTGTTSFLKLDIHEASITLALVVG